MPSLTNDGHLLMVMIVIVMRVKIHTTLFLASTGAFCTRRIRGHKEPSNVTSPFLRWLAVVVLFVHRLHVGVEAEVDAARVMTVFFFFLCSCFEPEPWLHPRPVDQTRAAVSFVTQRQL